MLFHVLLEVHPADVIHDDERPALVGVEVDHPHQIGMIASGEQPPLANQALAPAIIDLNRPRGQLEHELRPQGRMNDQKDLALAPLIELFQSEVAPDPLIWPDMVVVTCVDGISHV